MAILKGKRVILAGDHLQLPPTIKSLSSDTQKTKSSSTPTSAAESHQTLFDRLLAMYGEDVVKLLNIQYRMNEKISCFPSKKLYQGKLMADESVKNHTLADLDGVEKCGTYNTHLYMFECIRRNLVQQTVKSLLPHLLIQYLIFFSFRGYYGATITDRHIFSRPSRNLRSD